MGRADGRVGAIALPSDRIPKPTIFTVAFGFLEVIPI